MPLNKDLLKKAEAQNSKSAADFTIERQHARSSYTVEPNDANGPEIPQEGLDEPEIRQERGIDHGVLNDMFLQNHKPHSLDFQDRRQAFNPHKVSIPPTMPPKRPASAQQIGKEQGKSVHNQQQRGYIPKAQEQKPPVRRLCIKYN